MDRQYFDKLDLKSQIEYINKRLSSGESLRRISDSIGIQRKTIRVRFKRFNYEFNKESNKYICNTDVLHDTSNKDKSALQYKSNTNIIQDKTNKDLKKECNCIIHEEDLNKDNTLVLQDNIREDLFEIIEAKEDLFKIVQWFKKQDFNSNLIEIPELKIDKNKFSGEVKVTTIRIYSGIKDKFKNFSKNFPEFKSQDLYTQALLEFIDKYEK